MVEAASNRRPTPLERARELLGELFEEDTLAEETLVISGDAPIALTPTTWIRMLRRAGKRRWNRNPNNRSECLAPSCEGTASQDGHDSGDHA